MRRSVLLPVLAAFLCGGAWAAKKATTCNCGWTNSGRIVGGQEAKKNEFPFTAALFDPRTRLVGCGASIITRYHAITAAHCGGMQYDRNVLLLVGAHNTLMNEGTRVPILKWVLHPSYEKRAPVSDDIAIIVTRSAIPMSQNVGPVCLPSGRINIENQKVNAIGWGKQGFSAPASPVLKKVELEVIPYNRCRAFWQLTVPQSQICVMETGNGPCMGDSGGPWVWMDPETGRYTLVGVTSYGGKCVYPPPAVNTEVGAFIPWIKQTIQETRPEQICTKV